MLNDRRYSLEKYMEKYLNLISPLRTLLTLEIINFFNRPFVTMAIFIIVRIRKCISNIQISSN